MKTPKFKLPSIRNWLAVHAHNKKAHTQKNGKAYNRKSKHKKSDDFE